MKKNRDHLKNSDFRRDGFWVNFSKRPIRVCRVGDHQVWLRDTNNALQLGLTTELIARFVEYPYVYGDETERARFLLFVMSSAPVVRVRGHGTTISFQYCAITRAEDRRARTAIRTFCRQAGVGEYMGLAITNFGIRS